jgi:RNA 3'-terminal phosphate cyclase (ATP)
MTGRLILDGSHGEGGGQVLRTALTLSAITGRPITLENIRTGRAKPGLMAQHLTAVRAAAAICGAALDGDELDSTLLHFTPAGPARAGRYGFDVAAAREGGSAGSATLVLQTVLPPLALADGPSWVTVAGGTHTSQCPFFDYIEQVWLPILNSMGVSATVTMTRSGWFPIGQGRIEAHIAGGATVRPFRAERRASACRIKGRALTARLPAHIALRMAERAREILGGAGLVTDIVPADLPAACAGAGLFLLADYGSVRAGFSALGKRGKPAEQVAEEAAQALLDHHRSGAACDLHLGDQILVPAALAPGESAFTVARATRHLTTNAWVVEQFGLASVHREQLPSGPIRVRVAKSGT